MSSEKINVVYQWVAHPARWHELLYSVRSVAQNLQADFRLWVVGDSVPWLTNYEWIPHAFIKDQKRNLSLNAATQMEKALRHPEMGERIIYMYDDIVLLQPVTADDIAKPYAIADYSRMPRNTDGNWRKSVWATMDALKAEGKTLMNGETHLPRFFSKTTMLEILERYKVGENRLAAFTLYLNNMGLSKRDFVMLNKFDTVKAGFYGLEDALGYKCDSAALIRRVCEKKLFLNYNDSGLNPAMKEFLTQKFANKCRFEI